MKASAPHQSVARGDPFAETRGFYSQLTGAGPAAIAIVRIFGDAARAAMQQLLRAPWLAAQLPHAGAVRRATLIDAAGRELDDILVSFHAADACDVQLHLHGAPWIVRDVCDRLRGIGFRDAQSSGQGGNGAQSPFTEEAADPIERDALDLLPSILTLRGAKWLTGAAAALRAALHGLRAARDMATARGIAARIALGGPQIVQQFSRRTRVAFVGPPNAGKSTLLNALADQAISIVSDIPGTTRDWVEIPAEVDGFPVAWIDTAGLRGGVAPLEAAGIRRTHEIAAAADRVVLLLDGTSTGATATESFLAAYAGPTPHCVAITKADRPEFAEAGVAAALVTRGFGDLPRIAISAQAGSGLRNFARLAAIPDRLSGLEQNCPCAFTGQQVRYLTDIQTLSSVSDVHIVIATFIGTSTADL